MKKRKVKKDVEQQVNKWMSEVWKSQLELDFEGITIPELPALKILEKDRTKEKMTKKLMDSICDVCPSIQKSDEVANDILEYYNLYAYTVSTLLQVLAKAIGRGIVQKNSDQWYIQMMQDKFYGTKTFNEAAHVLYTIPKSKKVFTDDDGNEDTNVSKDFEDLVNKIKKN